MENPEDKHWAQRMLIDPLNEPEPSAETGPGTSFRPESTSTVGRHRASSEASKLSKSNPFRKSSSASKNPFVGQSEISRHNTTNTYPTPPHSASPRRDHFSHREKAFAGHGDAAPLPPPKDGVKTTTTSLRRGGSLSERYPGDRSHQPLATIKQERKAADRAPHMRKHHQIRPDTVDKLDATANYHHEGPFDATYAARNTSYLNSPLEALAGSNEEALKATPREKILDSVERHRPLDGVAAYAPGQADNNGRIYRYESGENMMVDLNPAGGAYKRWPGVDYHPDDIKGKGEPSYTVEKQLKDHKRHTSRASADGYEMTPRSRPTSDGNDIIDMYGDGEGIPAGTVKRSNTTGERKSNRNSEGGSMRRRFGSLRKSLGSKKDE